MYGHFTPDVHDLLSVSFAWLSPAKKSERCLKGGHSESILKKGNLCVFEKLFYISSGVLGPISTNHIFFLFFLV